MGPRMNEHRPQPDPRSRFEDEGIPDLQEGTPGQQWAQDPQEAPLPGDRPVGLDEYGTTTREMREGEPLDQRLSREVPDVEPRLGVGDRDEEQPAGDEQLDSSVDEEDPWTGDGVADVLGEGRDAGDLLYNGGEQLPAGRLVDPDEGLGEDVDKELIGTDVGPDVGGYSPEERAMYIEGDDRV